MVLMTSYIEMRERRGKDYDRKGEDQIEPKRGKKVSQIKKSRISLNRKVQCHNKRSKKT